MKRILSVVLCAIPLMAGCAGPSPERGPERWKKFQQLTGQGADTFGLELRTSGRSPTETAPQPRTQFTPGDTLVIEALTNDEACFYVFLMLPNDDVYMLLPSPLYPDHRRREIRLPPSDAAQELFIPEIQGTAYVGVIASQENCNLLSEGWIAPISGRQFPTWPARLPLDRALEFIRESFDEKPWTSASTSFEIIPKTKNSDDAPQAP